MTYVVVMLLAAVVALGALLGRNSARLSRTERNLDGAQERLRGLELSFRRFAPPEVVEAVAELGIHATTNRREVTVLFADLKGFTALSETLDPSELVDLLNGWLAAMDGAIAAHHGRVSKFMGDGVLALFGAMHTNPWQARDAVNAALAMRDALTRYNAAHGHLPLAMGVGIHRGEVVAGVMGSERLREFTVIGDVVNTAARVESLTRRFGVDILVTGAVNTALDGSFDVEEMPAAEVKGKADSLVTWAVRGRCAPGPG